MRKLIGCACAGALVVLLTGCQSNNIYPGGPSVGGFVYTQVKDPAQGLAVAVEPCSATKVGQSTATGVMGMVAVGDASVEAAMKNGGITKVHHVDHEVLSVLGLFVTSTTIVKGE